MAAKTLGESMIHLGLGATAIPQPPFTGMEWYAGYGQRSAPDGVEGRLVSSHAFTRSWDVWEMHPMGTEVVVCIAGSCTLVQEIDGEEVRETLEVGQYVINAPGVWHTCDVEENATCLFITAGMGTEHRPR